MNTTEETLSLQMLVTLRPAFILWVSFGCLNLMSSMCIIIGLLISKTLQKDTLCLVVQLTVAEALGGIAFAAIGVYHIRNSLFGIVETNTAFNCYFVNWFDLFITTASALFHVELSFDRFYASVFPIAYQNRSKYYSLLLSLTGWFLAILFYGVSYVDVSKFNIIPICLLRLSLGVYFVIFTYSMLTLSILSVVFYILTMILLRWEMYIVSKNGGNVVEVKKRMTNKAMKTLSVISAVHLLTFTMAAFGDSLVTPFVQKGALVGPYFAAFYRVEIILNFPIYLIFQKKFRDAFPRLIKTIFKNHQQTASVAPDSRSQRAT